MARLSAVPVMDGLILVGVGGILGALGFWLWTKVQDSQSALEAAQAPQFVGLDSSGNPTYVSQQGSIGVFQNQQPSAVGPQASTTEARS